MLEKFREAKQGEIAALRIAAEKGELDGARSFVRPSFTAAIAAGKEPISLIAEYKRASPSRGIICETVSVEDAATQYAEHASAISILTEESWFRGKLEYVNRASAATGGTIPLLRKDFIFDPLQILATASTHASAVLLIARMFTNATRLQELRELAESLGLDAVVEIFDLDDLALARASGARLIQVNARDLDTMRVDREAPLGFIRRNPPKKGELWIAASGMDRLEHLKAASNAGYAAALVGSGLMANGRPAQNLKKLLFGDSDAN